MKAALRSLVAAICRPATRASERARPGLRVLMYHRVARVDGFDQLTVSPERFDAQMRALAASRRVVGLVDGLRAVRAGALDQPMVAVTFDDGYLDNLVEAAPILLRHGVAATVFVSTGFCEQTMVHPRYAAYARSRLHLDWDEVAELASLPGIEIGSHTDTHPYLPRLPDARAREEIAGSRDRIARRLGRDVRAFCYPSGDVGAREARLALDAGYEFAVTVSPGVNRRGFDPMLVRRTEITQRDDAEAFALKLDGAFDPLHRLLHVRRQWRFERARATSQGNDQS